MLKPEIKNEKIIQIKVTDYENLINNNKDNFILALKLARLSNAIRSQKRMLYKVTVESENDDNVIKFKNRFDIILLLSSVLYESIKTYLFTIEDKIPLDSLSEKSKQKHSEFEKRYPKEKPKGDNFNNFLYTLRNRIVFHFDEKIIEETIAELHFNEDKHFFGYGASRQTKDVFFCISDDIIIHYIEKNFPSFCTVDEADFYGNIENKVLSESFAVAEYFDTLIADLLKGYLRVQLTSEDRRDNNAQI